MILDWKARGYDRPEEEVTFDRYYDGMEKEACWLRLKDGREDATYFRFLRPADTTAMYVPEDWS